MEEENNKIIIYNAEDGEVKIEVKVENETVWLSQKQMAELFDKDRKTITEHIGNVFKERELEENSVCRKFQHTAEDGKTYSVNFYNLDIIISVGYRVKSLRGTQFRIWATQKLRDYIVKGFAMNDWLKVELQRHILRNGKTELGKLEPQKLIFIKKLEMFLLLAQIIVQKLIMPSNFLQWCKINSILLSRV